MALAITRVFDAPAALVFKAWGSVEHMARWWGPKDSTCPHCKADFRPGGFCKCCGSFEPIGAFYAINVLCLDDVSDQELAAVPVAVEDSRNNRWGPGSGPAVTSYL